MGEPAAANAGQDRAKVLDDLQSLLQERRDEVVIQLVEKLILRNAELEEKLALFNARRGTKNEGISTDQLQLFLNAMGLNPDVLLREADASLLDASKNDEAKDEPGKGEDESEKGGKLPNKNRPPKQPPVRRPPPAHLRRVPNPISVPESERACPCCNGERVCIGHETTEVVDLIPAEVIVRQDIREKLSCPRCQGELVRAPMGDKVVTGGAYGARLVGHLIVGKYDDSLPLYRQGQQLERLGLKMSSSTMGDQITWGTDLLRPLWRYSVERVLTARVMHLDGTSLPVLDQQHSKGIRLGALWGYVGDEDLAVYLYTSTAKKNGQLPGELGPEDMLMRRSGFTVADASNSFDRAFSRQGIIEVGCNMHGRRGFIEALDAKDLRAAIPIAAYKKLYDIEERIRGDSESNKLALRQREAKPIFYELIEWCEKYKLVEPPKSPLGQAVGYIVRQQRALTRYLEHGFLPIDNGIVERLHRRVGVGRRNYLFAGSDAGAERAAIAYSILGTCRLLKIDSVSYLADVLPRLARDGVVERSVGELMPAAWMARQPAKATADSS